MMQLAVAPLDLDDLPAIVAIHVRAFPDSAITVLGPEAVRRYYEWLVDGPHDAVVMGAWQGAKLVGFCAAGVFRGAMNGFLRKNRGYLALHVASHPWLVLSPLIRERLRSAVEITLRFSRRRQRHDAAAAPAPPYGVLSIATDPDVRGSGAGRALMLDAEARARSLGHARMVLTVHPENGRAVRFYEQLGWSRRAETGAWSGAMQRELT
jgi:ribosomal protein S18 acetylase RimI-like enzyme